MDDYATRTHYLCTKCCEKYISTWFPLSSLFFVNWCIFHALMWSSQVGVFQAWTHNKIILDHTTLLETEYILTFLANLVALHPTPPVSRSLGHLVTQVLNLRSLQACFYASVAKVLQTDEWANESTLSSKFWRSKQRVFKRRVEWGLGGWWLVSTCKWQHPKLTTLRGWWLRKCLARTERVLPVVISNN